SIAIMVRLNSSGTTVIEFPEGQGGVHALLSVPPPLSVDDAATTYAAPYYGVPFWPGGATGGWDTVRESGQVEE
ncbi:hypothetical protein KIPB_016942, partial [Kipferlia bialata]